MSKVITQYECKICNKSYASYQSLWIHNKKFHTTVVLKTSETSEKTSETSENILKKNYNCRKCNKVFHNIKTRWSHEKICKQLVSNISNAFSIVKSIFSIFDWVDKSVLKSYKSLTSKYKKSNI